MSDRFSSDDKRIVEFVEQCKRLGLKATHQRIEIFREVIRTGDHPNAEAILRHVRRRMPTISKNTVYSTLQLFIDHGLLATMGIHYDRRRFDPNMKPHHHLVCLKCGKVSDFDWPEALRMDIPKDLAQWGQIDSSHVELRGTCSECMKKQSEISENQHKMNMEEMG